LKASEPNQTKLNRKQKKLDFTSNLRHDIVSQSCDTNMTTTGTWHRNVQSSSVNYTDILKVSYMHG